MKTRAAIAREAAGRYEVIAMMNVPPGPGEIMARMVAIAVCVSDQDMALGELPDSRPPALVWQAGAGIVKGISEGVIIGSVCPRWELLQGLQALQIHPRDSLRYLCTVPSPSASTRPARTCRPAPNCRAIIRFESAWCQRA